jgi:hypothetical protein
MEEIARQALDELNRLMRDKDAAIAGQFMPDAVLIGSERGEIARGRPAIAALFAQIHAKDCFVWWDFPAFDVGGDAGRIWFFAEGHAAIVGSGAARRVPYRLSAVIVASGDGWCWELFHGSEPQG